LAASGRYHVSQHFRVPAQVAFEWCTDYSPKDHALMGQKGSRSFKRISEDTILLDDVNYSAGKPVRRRKLVRLDPGNFTYYNIHLSGPGKDSLFVYRIVPDGEGESRLEFSAFKVYNTKSRPNREELARMLEADAASVHEEWVNLANAMEKDYRGKR
jgi:hypothetical protein